MMFRQITLTTALASVSGAAASANGKITTANGIPASSKAAVELLSKARNLEQNGFDMSFVADYSIKFQGCHHISQWNEEADGEDDVRVKTKRLVRFRLCETDSCSDKSAAGCNSKYGDYIVDMNTFVTTYMEAKAEEMEYKCANYQNYCYNQCYNSENENCYANCYAEYGVDPDVDCQEDNQWFDPMEYAECDRYDFPDNGNNNNRRELRRLDGDVEYFVGPYCADQGGEIHFGLFTDETCTTFSDCNENCFYRNTGFDLPYSDSNLVSDQCMSCEYSNNNGENNNNNNGYGVSEMCQMMYKSSGKCETKMSVDYPNESACTYIEGVKIIRQDGVIRTTTTKKSKAAAVCIGLFSTIAVLLAAYVYYLKTKLGRAKINLGSGASQSLT